MENLNCFEMTIKVGVLSEDTLERLEDRVSNIPDIIDLLNVELAEEISEWRVTKTVPCLIQDGMAVPIEEFSRDDMEPVAHVVQAIDTIICPENGRHLYEDTINVLNTLLWHAVNASKSPAERHRFERLLDAASEDIEVCGLTFE